MIRALVLAAALAAGTAHADTWTEYAPQHERAAALFGTAQGYWGGWNSFGNGGYIWCKPSGCAGGDIEWTEVRNCNGTEYWVLLAFEGNGHRWPIQTIKATITDLKTGATFDITNDCGTKNGHPYLLNQLVDWAYRVRIWGTITDARGVPQKQFYWESDIFPPAPKHNPCMGVTVPAVRQTEVWADADLSGKVTAVARGELSAPFDALGRPIVPQSRHGYEHWMGKGYGPAYMAGTIGGESICMMHRWNW